MTIFSSPAFEDHEALHAFHDGAAGLNCLIAIHSTALGPAGGGVRMWPYPDDQAAIDDALRLSRAMSHKNAMAGHGAGRRQDRDHRRLAARDKTPALFEALGRAIEQLGGRYWAAEDVGVSPADLTLRAQVDAVRRRAGGPSGRVRRSEPGHRRGRTARRRALRAARARPSR